MPQMASEAARFLRFALVGGTGFLVDSGLLAALHYGAGLDPFSARLISISVAAFTTWRLNRSLTFGASQRSQAVEGFRYALVAGITAAFNYAVYALALILWPALPPIAAVVLATLAAMLLSYAGYSRFVFAGAAGAATVATGGPSSQSR